MHCHREPARTLVWQSTSVSGSQFNSGFSQKNRCPPDSFSPGCARVALSNPASSLTKKCPRMGDGFITFAFPPTVLRTAFGKAGILPRAKNCPPDNFSPGCAWVALSNSASSLTKKRPRMGDGFIAFAFPPTVLRTAFGKPGILPRAREAQNPSTAAGQRTLSGRKISRCQLLPMDSELPENATGQFFPRLRLGRPFESRLFVNKKCPRWGWFHNICLSAHSPTDCVRKAKDSPTD